MEILVRLEREDDAHAVRAINEEAFGGPLEARIVDALRGASDSISLVALVDGRIVGHILFTPVRIDPLHGEVRVAGLAPMAVAPAFQRRGVGGTLIREGLAQCRALGYRAVVVVGHADYYPRFGFVPAHTRRLEYEHSVSPEAFMVLELEPGALDGQRGIVRYRPEFYST